MNCFLNLLNNRNRIIGILIFAIPYVILRIWSNYYFGLSIFDDSFSYCVPVDMMDNGMFPALNYRQIMYPLFIKFVLAVFGSTNYIPLVQSIMTFTVSLVFLINLSKLITTKRF